MMLFAVPRSRTTTAFIKARCGCAACGDARHLCGVKAPQQLRHALGGLPHTQRLFHGGLSQRLRQVFPGEEVLGPAPAPVLKLNNRFRYRLLLVGKNDKATRDRISWLLKEFANDRANRGLNIFVDCNTME